jgi:hypothetical protein
MLFVRGYKGRAPRREPRGGLGAGRQWPLTDLRATASYSAPTRVASSRRLPCCACTTSWRSWWSWSQASPRWRWYCGPSSGPGAQWTQGRPGRVPGLPSASSGQEPVSAASDASKYTGNDAPCRASEILDADTYHCTGPGPCTRLGLLVLLPSRHSEVPLLMSLRNGGHCGRFTCTKDHRSCAMKRAWMRMIGLRP